jgi:3-oxoacyl-[acyl-carrier protein] reductase
VLEVNLTGSFRAIRAALPPMLRARFGRIVNVASVVGLRANAGQANYAAAKAGAIGMTKTVAAEVARRGITVNAVAPGFVATKLTEGVIDERVTAAIPARRAGRPEEVAACIRFLASPQASYVTGTTLTVDGGLSA